MNQYADERKAAAELKAMALRHIDRNQLDRASELLTLAEDIERRLDKIHDLNERKQKLRKQGGFHLFKS